MNTNNENTPKTNTNALAVESIDLLALLDKWEDKINQLKYNAAGQHAIPKARINAEIKGMRLCKKHLKAII